MERSLVEITIQEILCERVFSGQKKPLLEENLEAEYGVRQDIKPVLSHIVNYAFKLQDNPIKPELLEQETAFIETTADLVDLVCFRFCPTSLLDETYEQIKNRLEALPTKNDNRGNKKQSQIVGVRILGKSHLVKTNDSFDLEKALRDPRYIIDYGRPLRPNK